MKSELASPPFIPTTPTEAVAHPTSLRAPALQNFPLRFEETGLNWVPQATAMMLTGSLG